MAIPASAAPATAATVFQSAIELFNVLTLGNFNSHACRLRRNHQRLTCATGQQSKRNHFNQSLPPICIYRIAACTGLRNTPIPSIRTSTTSPPASGPTPAGVPVAIRSPGSSAFMLDSLRVFCEDDCIRWTDDGSRGLQKNQRLLGDFVAELRGMSGIVTPDADNFSGLGGRQQTYRRQRPGLSNSGPFGPWGGGDFLNILAIQNAVSRKCRIAGGVGRNKSAEFHRRLSVAESVQEVSDSHATGAVGSAALSKPAQSSTRQWRRSGRKTNLRQGFRQIDKHGIGRTAFISRTIHCGHYIPVAMAGLYGDITIGW